MKNIYTIRKEEIAEYLEDFEFEDGVKFFLWTKHRDSAYEFETLSAATVRARSIKKICNINVYVIVKKQVANNYKVQNFF